MEAEVTCMKSVAGVTIPPDDRIYLWGILALALAVRLEVIIAGPYVIHPDELFQFYEQAHRLAFGSGVVPWEFHDGARSWLLPGVLSIIMRISRWVGSDPIYYIDIIRISCAILSLSVVYVGFELIHRRDGKLGAIITATLCAIWVDPIFFSPSLMPEVLSSYCILGGILVADSSMGRDTPRQMLLMGALLGLAVCLRVQAGPALLILVLFRCRTNWRRCWLPLLVGGGSVVIFDFGFLDFLTWGSPFHSVWHYLLRGVIQGFGGGYANHGGIEGLHAYTGLIVNAWTPLGLPLAALIVVGVFRLPLLSIVVVTFLETHLAFANTEYRYLCFALLAFPILMGSGAIFISNIMTRCFASASEGLRHLVRVLASAAILVYSALASYTAANTGSLFEIVDRGVLQAFLLAHRQSDLCGLGTLGISWLDGGAYTFLDRDVPLYPGNFYKAMSMGAAGILIPQSVVLDHEPLPLYQDGELAHAVGLYNFLIARSDYQLDGFSQVRCFNRSRRSTNSQICLYRRSGECELPFVMLRHPG